MRSLSYPGGQRKSRPPTVQVKMEHGLPCAASVVEHSAVAFGQFRSFAIWAATSCSLPSKAASSADASVSETRCLLGTEQDVHRGLRLDVLEGEDLRRLHTRVSPEFPCVRSYRTGSRSWQILLEKILFSARPVKKAVRKQRSPAPRSLPVQEKSREGIGALLPALVKSPAPD